MKKIALLQPEVPHYRDDFFLYYVNNVSAWIFISIIRWMMQRKMDLTYM